MSRPRGAPPLPKLYPSLTLTLYHSFRVRVESVAAPGPSVCGWRGSSGAQRSQGGAGGGRPSRARIREAGTESGAARAHPTPCAPSSAALARASGRKTAGLRRLPRRTLARMVCGPRDFASARRGRRMADGDGRGAGVAGGNRRAPTARHGRRRTAKGMGPNLVPSSAARAATSAVAPATKTCARRSAPGGRR